MCRVARRKSRKPPATGEMAGAVTMIGTPEPSPIDEAEREGHIQHSMASALNNLPSGANWCPGGVDGNVRSYELRFCFLTPLRAPSLRSPLLIARARPRAAGDDKQSKNSKDSEKALDLVEFTGTVTHAIPGPRVGQSPLPWILAVPLAYVGLTFVFAVFKTVKKMTSPRAQRKRLVNKNAVLLRSIDELFQKGRDEVNHSALEGLMHKSCVDMCRIDLDACVDFAELRRIKLDALFFRVDTRQIDLDTCVNFAVMR
ncbi:hypothetical protein KSP40_PGU020240 [Platanthera guangdongensis]|uniref:Uncharacterized protein n=1 Tax=Platanthera guangdongensis TaxID=2320717 RepID=A0ABR2LM87_9ASPA